MAEINPTTDALIDPGVTQQVADIYGQNGPQGPGLQPPAFMTNAVNAMQTYGQSDLNANPIAGGSAPSNVVPFPRPAPAPLGPQDAQGQIGGMTPPPQNLQQIIAGANLPALSGLAQAQGRFAAGMQATPAGQAANRLKTVLSGTPEQQKFGYDSWVKSLQKGATLSPDEQQAADQYGMTIAGGFTGPEEEAARFAPQVGKTLSTVVDTLTGKTIQMFNGADHAAQAATAAAARNAATPAALNVAKEVTPESVFGNPDEVKANARYSYPNPAPFERGAAPDVPPEVTPAEAQSGATQAFAPPTGAASDNIALATKMRAAGATEAEIRLFMGKDNYVPPHPDSPVPTIPANDPLIAEAQSAGPVGQEAIANANRIADETTGAQPKYTAEDYARQQEIADRQSAEIAASRDAESAGTSPSAAPDNAPPYRPPGGYPKPPAPGGPIVPKNFTAATAWGLARDSLYNSLIAPTISLLHPMGSALMAVERPVEQLGLSAVTKVTGKGGFYASDAVNSLKAQGAGMGGAIQHDLWNIITKGPTSVMNDVDAPSEVSTAILRGEYGSTLAIKSAGVAGKLLALGNYPSRVVSALDWTIRQGLKSSYLMENGYRDGRSLGLNGDALDAHAVRYMKAANANELSDAAQAADMQARTQINRQPPGAAASRFLDAKDRVGPLGTVILPFFNTANNIFKSAVTWSPLGFARLLPKDFPGLGYFARDTVGEAARVQAATRATLGTAAIYGLWQQVLSDNITGDGPVDPKQKMLWDGDPKNPAHQPRSIRLGNDWVSYGKIPVFGAYLAAVADGAEAIKNNPKADIPALQAAYMGMMNYFSHEETGLVNAASTIGALGGALGNPNDPQAQAALAQQLSDRMFELTPGSGLWRAAANIADPNYRGAPKGADFPTRVGNDFMGNFPGQTNLTATGVRRPGGVEASLPIQVSPIGPAFTGTAQGMPPGISAEAQRLAQADPAFKGMNLPSNSIGTGTPHEVKLLGDQYPQYATYVGQARESVIGSVLVSSAYLNAPEKVQEKMFADAVLKADKQGTEAYLKNGVTTSNDPVTVQADAVAGFTSYTSNADKADWIALLNSSGKLTPAVRVALSAVIPPPLPGTGPKPTVDEYLKAAPLVHEYLGHVPYGTDAKPFGTPQEWAALPAAKVQHALLTAQIQKTAPSKAAVPYLVMAKEMKMPSGVPGLSVLQLTQKYSALVENPVRRALMNANPWLQRYLPAGAASSQGTPSP